MLVTLKQKRLGNVVRHVVVGLLIFATASVAVGQNLPVPRNHVEDRAGVIKPDVERRLISVLADLERKTGAQMIVLTIKTTGGVPIKDYTLALGERWKLGHKKEENGALVVVAVKDRKYQIETGYGLEGVLPDSFCGSVGRKYFQPYFRQGDYSNGIYQGVLALVQKVANEANVSISGAAAPIAQRSTGRSGSGRRPRAGLLGSCGILPIIIMIVVFNILRGRAGYRRRWGGSGGGSWLTLMLLGSMLGGGRRFGGGSSWGGGFGGGGFGGGSFGGGGGGGFGGGGAGGSW